MKLWEDMLDFVFPPHCPVCDAYVESRGGWCEDCLRKTLCVTRLPLSAGAMNFLDEVWTLGRYHGGLSHLIRALKYQRKRDRLPYLQRFLEAAKPQLTDFLRLRRLAVPVPLHPRREKERGFNQAELVFKEWLADCGIPTERLLVRARETEPQYGLDAKARARNMRDAFAIAAGVDVQGKELLLVDDIFTTGATMLECAKVLKRHGAKKVDALTLASDHRVK